VPGPCEKQRGEGVPRVGRLDRMADLRLELGRLYRSCRRGDVPPDQARALTAILRELRELIELTEIEARLDQLDRDPREDSPAHPQRPFPPYPDDPRRPH